MLNGNASFRRVTNEYGMLHDIPPPMVGQKRADGKFQVTLELNGSRRTTDLPLTNGDIAELGP